MNLLRLATNLLAANEAASTGAVSNPDPSCMDSATFFLEGNPDHGCEWIKSQRNGREAHCAVKEVRDHCPILCGICCEDTSSFQFQIDDEVKDCAWIANNKSFCFEEVDGKKVSDICPKTCDACNGPVPFEEITSFDWSPNDAVDIGDTSVKRRAHLECRDDPHYKSPINPNFGCEIYDTEFCSCDLWELLLKGEEVQEMYTSCPDTCNVPCDYTVSPTVSPSVSPTEKQCADDPTYANPAVAGAGCEIYTTLQCDCFTFEKLMTHQELKEVFERCPVACDVPCDYEPPTRSPSYQSPTPAPTVCSDDPHYVSPINSNFGCEFFDEAELTCDEFSGILSPEQLDDLLRSCPHACEVDCP